MRHLRRLSRAGTVVVGGVKVDGVMSLGNDTRDFLAGLRGVRHGLSLGYEASSVRSRVFAADAERAAAAAGLPVNEYLAAHNPMTPAGEARLWPVTTELAVPVNEAFVVVLNNSLPPHGPGRVHGVLHKAEVPVPDPTAERVINSVGLMLCDDPTGSPKAESEVVDFLRRSTLD